MAVASEFSAGFAVHYGVRGCVALPFHEGGAFYESPAADLVEEDTEDFDGWNSIAVLSNDVDGSSLEDGFHVVRGWKPGWLED